MFEAFRPTLFFGVPTMYVRLLELPLETSRAIGGDVRLFVSGSAPLPAHVLRGVSRAVRPRDPRALRHERDAHEHRATRTPASGGPGTVGLAAAGVSARIVDEDGVDVGMDDGRRAAGARPERVRRLLAAAGRDGRGVRGRLVPHRRPGRAIGRWLLHAARAPQRPDHLGRLQHLSARDRGAAARAAAACARRRSSASPIRVRGEVPVAYVVADDPIDVAALEATLPRSRSRRSRCRAASCASTRCRARRSARCRSTCCRPGVGPVVSPAVAVARRAARRARRLVTSRVNVGDRARARLAHRRVRRRPPAGRGDGRRSRSSLFVTLPA